MVVQNKRITGLVLVVSILLLIPLVAMQFSDEVNWGPLDFAVAAFLLLGAGLLVDLSIRKLKTAGQRTAIIFAVLAALVLVWAELAVGIFGSPFAGA